MKQTIQTGLDIPNSKKAIDKAMEAYSARFAEYQPRFAWKGETLGEFGFSAKGLQLQGSMNVREGAIDVDMDVPFLLRVFQGKAMEVIQEQVSFWVEKVKKGEL